MVGVFSPGVLTLGSRNWRFSKKTVGVNHVVDDAALRNLVGLELGFGGEIASIIVVEMVVGEDEQRLDTGFDQELSEDELEFSVTRLKIVAPDEGTFVCRSMSWSTMMSSAATGFWSKASISLGSGWRESTCLRVQRAG